MSRYHDSITGKFVSKQYAKDNPETTVKLTHLDLKGEILIFCKWLHENSESNAKENLTVLQVVEKYLKEKE